MVKAMNDSPALAQPAPGFAHYLHAMLDRGPFPGSLASAYRMVITACATIGTLIPVARTADGFAAAHGLAAMIVESVVMLVLVADVGAITLDIWLTPPAAGRVRGLLRYISGPWGWIDMAAALPFLISLVAPFPPDLYIVLCVARFLKLARFSPALETLEAVLRREVKPLRAAIFILLLVILCSSILLYLIERADNPGFQSVPDAMWWSVVTLTTLGYGDAVPASPLGKLLGGVVAVMGVGMFALPASILATGFSEEVKRRDFLHTWHMVAKVPFFAELDADQIAAIIGLLRPVQAMPGVPLMRIGDLGDRMFFVVAGEVEVALPNNRQFVLKEGAFFGEIALINSSRRTATVSARNRCQLLALDARDFREFLAGSPQIAKVIAHTAHERMNQQAEFQDSDLPAEL